MSMQKYVWLCKSMYDYSKVCISMHKFGVCTSIYEYAWVLTCMYVYAHIYMSILYTIMYDYAQVCMICTNMCEYAQVCINMYKNLWVCSNMYEYAMHKYVWVEQQLPQSQEYINNNYTDSHTLYIKVQHVTIWVNMSIVLVCEYILVIRVYFDICEYTLAKWVIASTYE